jgi:hypothetical protein
MSDEMPPSPNGSGDRQQQPLSVKENLKTRSTWLRLFFYVRGDFAVLGFKTGRWCGRPVAVFLGIVHEGDQ